MGRLILDTAVLVASDRGTYDPGEMQGSHDPALPAIAVAEFRYGMLRSPEPRRRQSAAFLEHVLELLPVEDYTLAVAEHHAELLAHTAATGRPRGGHDLIIAATARATKRTILTLDRKAAYDDLPGVEVMVLTVRP